MCVCVCVCAHAWVRTCLVGECDLCAHDTLICSVVRLDVCAGSPVSQSAQNDENSLRYLLTLILCQASNRFECHLTHAFWSHSLLMPSTFGIFPAKCHCRRRTWQRKKKRKMRRFVFSQDRAVWRFVSRSEWKASNFCCSKWQQTTRNDGWNALKSAESLTDG